MPRLTSTHHWRQTPSEQHSMAIGSMDRLGTVRQGWKVLREAFICSDSRKQRLASEPPNALQAIGGESKNVQNQNKMKLLFET
ncbi:hypothetical protein CEXT_124621 [Caerostris extrusa]|uniref:Uncharacterized protein n=1 Tax=Caerostris extrusa TaxID=172846 RepID=A0AAV4X429_CAEEX|nr:hypothetical protein CEXT_124621 [Caerostris extrusa]